MLRATISSLGNATTAARHRRRHRCRHACHAAGPCPVCAGCGTGRRGGGRGPVQRRGADAAERTAAQGKCWSARGTASPGDPSLTRVGIAQSASSWLSLLGSCLQPIIRREEDGSYQAHRPSVGELPCSPLALQAWQDAPAARFAAAPQHPLPCIRQLGVLTHPHQLGCLSSPHAVCPRPTPTNIVQLLVAGVFLHVTGNAEPAIAMLSAALSGVWPPAVETQRRLVARHFIPSVELEPAGQQREGGGSGGAADGVAASAAEAEEAGAAAGGGGSQVPAPESSAAGGQPPNEFAAALAEALKRHCPEVSAPDLQKSALVLRLFLGCRAVGQQAAAAQQPAARQQQQPPGGGGGSDALPGPGFQAIIRTLLLDCQQLLDLDPACMHAYVWAAQLALQARWPLEPARMAALLREGARRAADAQCELSRPARWLCTACGSFLGI